MRTPLSVVTAKWWIMFISPAASAADDVAAMRPHLIFYASFDEAVRGDFGGGTLLPSTRRDNPAVKGAYLYREGVDDKVFRIARGKGVHGGALEAVDVLPDRGRIFFPARGNLPYRPGGWGGAVSCWLNTDPNTLLKTPFCDPVQITEKGASNGGLWVDFPEQTPRDLRMGVFPAMADGEKPVPESDPQAPLVVVKKIGFKSGEWHHLVMSWENLDTDKANAKAVLYIDGEAVGRLEGRKISMKWDLDRAGIYFAVNYLGLLDELAVFDRALTPGEVRRLREDPGAVARLKRPVDAKDRKSP